MGELATQGLDYSSTLLRCQDETKKGKEERTKAETFAALRISADRLFGILLA